MYSFQKQRKVDVELLNNEEISCKSIKLLLVGKLLERTDSKYSSERKVMDG